jgi:superfamily II DNA or RNA helicase
MAWAGRFGWISGCGREDKHRVAVTKLGLYEQILDDAAQVAIADLDPQQFHVSSRPLDAGDSHSYLVQHLARQIDFVLRSLPVEGRLDAQVALSNKIVDLLEAGTPPASKGTRAGIRRADLLLAIAYKGVERPDTPLGSNCLITGTRQDPSLVSQLCKEFATADSVDILCSFIKWSGVRIIEDSLRILADKGRPIRVITTSYMGATDQKAVEALSKIPGTTVKISYDTRRTRLHAKAYMIHRQTGFSVAYIGSSNISQAALTDGLEWNVKISEYEAPHLWEKVCATFETYWNDQEFASYSAESREQLRIALREERPGDEERPTFFFDIKPYTYQEVILEKLQAERTIHNRYRNLLVAATGTGKTVIAAFDYARFSTPDSTSWRLLFVAHREEILKQSLHCFRIVVRDYNFGELLVGGHEPENLDHLFTSIQSLNSRELWRTLPAEHYDFVVVDEFHHAAAPSYRRLLDWIKPKVLLALTATPERHDELDILGYFDHHIAAEIRLPDAINRKLLSPFQYFGITDCVDFSTLRWQRGGYLIEDLDKVLTGNDVRAALVIDKIRALLLDVKQARGLGFCVSIQHAEYMAKVFLRAGIPSAPLSAQSPPELRRTVQKQLIARELNFIFVVDLYNEGVDIPELDTIIFLRPTESLTVFLQQLGRGLRLHEKKDCLTVLDFIGQAHANYNFEARFRALSADPTRQVGEEIKHGFCHLPAGCVISLEKVAREYVLENIRHAISHNRNRLIQRIATFEKETGLKLSLTHFVEYHRLELEEIYRRDCWSNLCVKAGVLAEFSEPDTDRLAKGLRRLQHVSGVHQIRTLIEILDREPGGSDLSNESVQRFLLMLHCSLWGRDWLPASIAETVERLRKNPMLLTELRSLLSLKLALVDELAPVISVPFFCPLEFSAEYTRDEILAALGVWRLDRQRDVREGVLWVEEIRADLLFITLDKTETDYSPTTMYNDYAISDSLFHWQSQSTTSAEAPVGKRYIEHRERGSTVMLFVRQEKRRNSLASPYSFLGPADYVSHQGSRPMNIIWKLRHPMPAKFLQKAARLLNE